MLKPGGLRGKGECRTTPLSPNDICDWGMQLLRQMLLLHLDSARLRRMPEFTRASMWTGDHTAINPGVTQIGVPAGTRS